MTPPRAPTRLTIESIAAGGDGIGRADGLAVFVPRAAPGDVLDVVLEPRGRFARGRIVSIVHPSPQRIEPPCPHYVGDACGGCQLQHLAMPWQLDAKTRIVRDAFARIARQPVDVPSVRESPRPWRYRRKLTLAMRYERGAWRAGLHAWDDPDRVFALRDCLIADATVVAAWHDVIAASRFLPRARSLRGAIRLAASGPVFMLEGGARWPDARAFAAAVPALVAIWWEGEHAPRRLLVDRRPANAPDASFVQVNPDVAEQLREHLVSRVMAHRPRTVVDAYAGAGDTAHLFAAQGAQVTAIERDPEAAAHAAERLAAPSRAIAARVEDALDGALPADVVVLNPPRQGIDARVARILARPSRAPRAILYVSCEPATLARDVGRLAEGGFRAASVVPFDMFPQTAHVECVCELIPEAS